MNDFMLVLARMSRWPGPPPLPLSVASAVYTSLSILLILLGLVLLLLAYSIWQTIELDTPPRQLNAETATREAAGISCAALLFIVLAGFNWADAGSAMVMLAAGIVIAGWGGTRLFLSSGAAKSGKYCLLIGGSALIFVGAAALAIEIALLNRLAN